MAFLKPPHSKAPQPISRFFETLRHAERLAKLKEAALGDRWAPLPSHTRPVAEGIGHSKFSYPAELSPLTKFEPTLANSVKLPISRVVTASDSELLAHLREAAKGDIGTSRITMDASGRRFYSSVTKDPFPADGIKQNKLTSVLVVQEPSVFEALLRMKK